jgi:AcrR family transcriptional regulator
MVDETSEPSLPLVEEQRQLTRARIRQAAMAVVGQRGFDATVQEISRESGVSPRTIFRHYENQRTLIFATVKDMFEAVGARPIPGLPSPLEDLEGWLRVLATTVHTRNAEVIGNAFWDLHGPDDNGNSAFDDVAAYRRASRLDGVHHLASVAWQTAGGTGEPPASLESAFALNFSTFATQALMIDFDQTPTQIGELTADILHVLLRRAVDAQGDTPPDEVSGGADR